MRPAAPAHARFVPLLTARVKPKREPRLHHAYNVHAVQSRSPNACAGGALFIPDPSHVVALTARLPWELHALLSMGRSVAEVAALLGSATLVLQAVTLGASLLPKQSSASLWDTLVPASRWEWRQLLSTASVRLLAMPLVGLASVHQMSAWGLLPQSAACKMALLVQSCMPSAQNLVLLVNLKSGTKAMAPIMAQLLFRQYMLAVIPTTLWISVFLAYIGATPV